MNILGIWDGHDSGAALLRDGCVVAAVNEERLSRRKLEIRFPRASIAACLREAGIRPDQIDLVAASTLDPAKALARVMPATKEAYYQLRRRKATPGLMTSLVRRGKYWLPEFGPNAISAAIGRASLRSALARVGLGETRLEIYDHHDSHAAAAALTSGWPHAIVLTIDGVGDGLSSTVSRFDEGRLTRLDATRARHSPGIFFECVTNLLNMRELEDEGKVMALASYAPLPERNPLREVLYARGLRFETDVPGHRLQSRLRAIHWAHPNEQFAAMAQDALEHACLAIVQEATARTGIRQIALAGGVAQNIKMSRRIRLLDGVEDVSVYPHMGDGGLALGAALRAAQIVEGRCSVELPDLGLGPSFSDEELLRALQDSGLRYERPRDLSAAVADQLTNDRVVLWFQGRMEYGPRALGHRSILARADKTSVRDRLNLVLKRRVWYQPFCPSLLESDGLRVFEDCTGRPNRHMTMGYLVRDWYRASMAGVISADGTCRPQLVSDTADGPFAALLREMRARLGLSVVLNTSFNIHGEPMVCSPEQAIDVFRRSGADALVLGPALVLAPRPHAAVVSDHSLGLVPA